jgi:hypothetical protein
MYKGWAIKLALAPRPLMIYCASPLTAAMIITVAALRIICRAKKKIPAGRNRVICLFNVLLNPEHVSNVFLRNVGKYIPSYTVPHPKRDFVEIHFHTEHEIMTQRNNHRGKPGLGICRLYQILASIVTKKRKEGAQKAHVGYTCLDIVKLFGNSFLCVNHKFSYRFKCS